MVTIIVRGLLLYVLITTVFGERVIFHDCGSLYDLHAVYIDGCTRTLPCRITLGAETNVQASFVASFASSRLNQDVVIEVNAVPQRPRVFPDPCATTWCPLVPMGTFTFNVMMEPPTSIPINQLGTLEWRVYNEESRMVLCYSVMVIGQTLEQRDRLIARDINNAIFNNTINKFTRPRP